MRLVGGHVGPVPPARAARTLCFLERARAARGCGHCHNLARDFANIWTPRSALRFGWSHPLVPECQYGLRGVSVLLSCCAPSGDSDAVKQSAMTGKPCRADTQKLSNLGSSKERHCATARIPALFHVQCRSLV